METGSSELGGACLCLTLSALPLRESYNGKDARETEKDVKGSPVVTAM
jgi:hypothetical protein